MTTTRTHSARKAVRGFKAVTALIGIGLAVLAMIDSVDEESVTFDAVPGIPSQSGQIEADALIEEHDCWTGQPPADMVGQIPGHVVTQHGYQGTKAVDLALKQVFEGADNGLQVFAFCR